MSIGDFAPVFERYDVRVIKRSVHYGLNHDWEYKIARSVFVEPQKKGTVLSAMRAFLKEKYISAEEVRDLGLQPENIPEEMDLGVVFDSKLLFTSHP